MTTTPAMPELPEPELGYIETDKSRQPAFSARQMRAALQAQPAEVSDAEIDAVTLEQWGPDAIRAAHRQYARAILALRPQSAPVGEAVTMPGASGFTMAFFPADKVPVGTKLHVEALRPQAVPMTPAQIGELAEGGVFLRTITEIVSAIEAHHGVKENV